MPDRPAFGVKPIRHYVAAPKLAPPDPTGRRPGLDTAGHPGGVASSERSAALRPHLRTRPAPPAKVSSARPDGCCRVSMRCSTPTRSTATTPNPSPSPTPRPINGSRRSAPTFTTAEIAPTTHRDRIYVPGIDQYDDPAAFYSTVLHEHVHWTGHTSRLNRPELGHTFDSAEYAAEELVAELGSAIACARLGISPQPRPDHAAYLAHWLKALDADPKALFRSAAAAQRAVDLLETLASTKSEEAAA